MNPAFVLQVIRSHDIKLTTEVPLHCTGSASAHRPRRQRFLDILTYCYAAIFRNKTVESVTSVGTSEQ
jgi:hypothetical protein